MLKRTSIALIAAAAMLLVAEWESSASSAGLAFVETAKILEKYAGAITAIFTIVLAISTILLWNSTKHVARGAERSANIAEQALISLERPFVFVKEINLFTERAGGTLSAAGNAIPGRVIAYKISVILENSGQSPALRAIFNFSCGYIAAENIDSFNFPDQSPDNRGIIGPKATLHTLDKTISPANIAQMVSGVDRWFIWGWVDYDDILPNTQRHRTEYCFEVKARSLPSGEIFIGFPMHTRFNGTDGDCLRKPKPYSPAA